MAQIRRTTGELLAEEEKKRKQVRERMAELKARQRIEERKRDNHRKIVGGATLFALVKLDPPFRKTVQDRFNRFVKDPKLRAVIRDLLDENAFQESLRAAARKAAEEAKEAALAGDGEYAPDAASGNNPADSEEQKNAAVAPDGRNAADAPGGRLSADAGPAMEELPEAAAGGERQPGAKSRPQRQRAIGQNIKNPVPV